MVIYNWREKTKGKKPKAEAVPAGRVCALKSCENPLTEKQKKYCCREHSLLSSREEK